MSQIGAPRAWPIRSRAHFARQNASGRGTARRPPGTPATRRRDSARAGMRRRCRPKAVELQRHRRRPGGYRQLTMQFRIVRVGGAHRRQTIARAAQYHHHQARAAAGKGEQHAWRAAFAATRRCSMKAAPSQSPMPVAHPISAEIPGSSEQCHGLSAEARRSAVTVSTRRRPSSPPGPRGRLLHSAQNRRCPEH